MQRTKDNTQHKIQMEKEEANQGKKRAFKKNQLYMERAQRSKRVRMIENCVRSNQCAPSLRFMCVKKFIFFYAVADSYRCFIDIRSWIDFFLFIFCFAFTFFLLQPEATEYIHRIVIFSRSWNMWNLVKFCTAHDWDTKTEETETINHLV